MTRRDAEDRANQITGKIGEKMAVKHLLSAGYRIIETNFRSPFGEIDIIAKKGDEWVFLEVKTRVSPALGSPLLSINRGKRDNIIKSSLYYMKRNGLEEANCRIDVVSVELDDNMRLERLEHIRNAIDTETELFY
jgi:putative endonuclease